MNNFDKYWRSAKKSVFRLEGRAEYRLPGERENIAKWKADKLDLGKDKIWAKWMESLRNAKERGIVVQRVRVTPQPIPEYIKYEIALWQALSSKNGEKVLFLGCDEYQKIIAGLGFNLRDFWLFDDETLLIFNYDK